MIRAPRARRLRPLCAERLELRKLLASDLQQLGNINDNDPFGGIIDSAEVNGKVFFTANEPGATRLDLWITDGTSAGTSKLADIGPLAEFGARTLTNVNGVLFFQGTDDVHGRELWKSDGTAAGTGLVKDLAPGPAGSSLSDFLNFNGTLLLSADGELTRSNGQSAGTFAVTDLQPSQSDYAANLTEMGGSVYFTAQRSGTGAGLFKTDGTAAGTTPVFDAGGFGTLSKLTNVSDTLYFASGGNTLWKSDGTGGGTALVSDFQSAPFGAVPYSLTNVSGELFFTSEGDLWKSDGTQAGTVFLKDAGLAAFSLFNMNGQLFFAAGNAQQFGDGYELWTSDGTAAGTTLVKDLAPGFFEGYGDSSNPGQFTNFNGTLYFTAAESNGGRPLWTTNGTAAGTTKVESGFVGILHDRGGSLLFSRTTPVPNTFSLWSTSGAPGAAFEIPRLGPGAGSSSPSTPVDINGTLYFAANDGEHGIELWKLVGDTPTMVKDIVPGQVGSGVANLINHRGTLFFTAFSSSGLRVWRSDGTAAGTISVAGTGFASPSGFTSVGNNLFFSAFDNEGFELWKTDGTTAARLKDINPGTSFNPYDGVFPNSSFPGNLVNFNGQLCFSATGPDGRELWKSDGTAAGTVLVKDIFPGFSPYPSPYFPYASSPYDSAPSDLVNMGGVLYFTAYTPESNQSLWKSDGTEAGTQLVRGVPDGLGIPAQPDLTVVGQTLFFLGIGDGGYEIWKSDGTTNGTVRVKDIRVGPGGSYGEQLTNVGGKLYFVARDGTAGGRELWQSDGTDAGTYLVKDIRPGLADDGYPLGSEPTNLTALNGVLFFTADDGVHGRELWRTNGNGSAVMVDDLVPGPGSSLPQNLFGRGNALFFSATTETGRELWRARGVAPQLTIAPATWSHVEDDPAKILAPTAALNDTDTPILVGGRIRVTVVGHPSPGDELSIAATGLISTAGNVVYHKVSFLNIAIGKFSGGSGGKPLVIELNQNATVGEVQWLLRAIQYRTSSQNPSLLQRTIRFELSDGEGTAAPFQQVKVNIYRRNDAPVLNAALNPILNPIVEDVRQPAGTLVKNFAAAGISDVDGNPKGIAVTQVGSATSGRWQFSRNNGTNWQDFGTPSETAARLLSADLATRIRFIPNHNFNGQVQILYRAWDGAVGGNGGVLNTTGQIGGDKTLSTDSEVATLIVTPVNDAPVLALGGLVGYQRNAAAVTLAPGAILNDIDQLDFAGGTLTIRIAPGGIANRLEIGAGFTLEGRNVKFGATVIGTLNANGGVGTTNLIVTFHASATQESIQQLIRSITFRTVGGAAGERKAYFSVTDGDGGSSGELLKTVNVT